MIKNIPKLFFEFLLVSIIFLLVCFFSKNQQRISHNQGQGMDGVFYFHIAEGISKGKLPIQGELPYINRIGSLYLTAIHSNFTHKTLLDSGFQVNLFGTYITVILLVFWLKIYIKEFWLRILLCTLYQTAWFVPLRFLFYYPLYPDAWGAAFLVGGLLVLHRIRLAYSNNLSIFPILLLYTVLVSMGYLFRESLAVLAFAPLFICFPIQHRHWARLTQGIPNTATLLRHLIPTLTSRRYLQFFLPIIGIVFIKIFISHYLQITPNGYSYIKATFVSLYTKSFPQFFLGLLLAVGPLFLLLPLYIKEIFGFIIKRQELVFLFFVSLVFGFIGGSDTERIFFMSCFPILLVLLGKGVQLMYQSSQRWWLFVLLFIQTIAYRWYWVVPDFPTENTGFPIPFFTLLGNQFNYLFLYSQHGHPLLNSLLLIQYGILFLISWLIVKKKNTILG